MKKRSDRLKKAAKLFRDFTGEDAENIDVVTLPDYGEAVLIGRLDGVLYTTVRDSVKESYIHKFSVKSRPLLACSFDGRQLYIIGGEYTFTECGIIDT